MKKKKKKNWRAISAVGNKPLRMNLIAASGEVAEGLAQGFPQCFLTEEEEHPRMSQEEFLAVVGTMERRDNVVEACKQAGIPHQRFCFTGTCRGFTDGVPYANGGYDTVRNGWGDYFWRCNKRQGETLEYNEAQWMVVWNGYVQGDVHMFSSHSLVLVPVDALC